MNKVMYTLNQNGSVHGFLVEKALASRSDIIDLFFSEREAYPELKHTMSKVVITNESSCVADFCEEGSTVTVTIDALIDDEEYSTSFHVQTVDGSHSTERGCWITTNTSSDDMDFDRAEKRIFACCDIIALAESEISLVGC